jgi:hypothetical protein
VLACPSAMCDASWRPLPEDGILFLDFPASQTIDQMNFCCIIYPVCGILL